MGKMVVFRNSIKGKESSRLGKPGLVNGERRPVTVDSFRMIGPGPMFQAHSPLQAQKTHLAETKIMPNYMLISFQ